MNKEVEEWRDIPEYEGYYQVSDMGRVRSLDRVVSYSNGYDRFYKGGLIEGFVNGGYRQTTLRKGGGGRTFKFSQLVAMAFLNHKPFGLTLVVDHVNGDKSDDRVGNLQIVTHRENSSICFRSDKDGFSSEYAGIYWNAKRLKWYSMVQYEGRRFHLGSFGSETEASNAYQSAVIEINNGSFNPADYKPKWTSSHKGVSFRKDTQRWLAYTTINGKRKGIGYFHTESEAHNAKLQFESREAEKTATTSYEPTL